MKTILIPTDLGPDTANLLAYAIPLGIAEGTVLYFVHATQASTHEAETALQQAVSQAFADSQAATQYRTLVRETDFSPELIRQLVDELNADLVVMATGEHGGLERTFFGASVTSLIAMLSCPVLALPRRYPAGSIRSIGYATDLVDLSERLREIVPFARRLNAQIDVFHVYPIFPEQISVEGFPTVETLRTLRQQNQYEAVNLHFIKTPSDNDVQGGIHQFIQAYKPDLLVMCHRPRGLFDRMVFNVGETLGVAQKPEIPLLALSEKTACRIM